jgi:hypothetical protein
LHVKARDITLAMSLILLTPAPFDRHFDVLHRSSYFIRKGVTQFKELRIFGAIGCRNSGGAERKKNFLFLMSYLMFKFPLDLALWGAKLEFFQQDPF